MKKAMRNAYENPCLLCCVVSLGKCLSTFPMVVEFEKK